MAVATKARSQSTKKPAKLKPKKISGAEIIYRSLEREGVKYVFGHPGAILLTLLDLFLERSKIKHLLIRHEQCAAHMAEGYARASGEVGVCLTTSGPGATNLITGITDAYMDSIPIVCLTGQVATTMVGNDAFQEADIVGMTRTVTKHSYLVKSTDDLAETIQEAFYIARTGRPGPVLVDLPKDVLLGDGHYQIPEKVDLRGYKPTTKGHPKQIQRVAEAIKESKQPLLYVGGGAIHAEAHKEILKLAETAEIPVTYTLLGAGAFPSAHELSLGMLGMHGTAYANYATMECDLLIAVGARFDDRVTGKVSEFATRAKIIHIDIDPTAIGKNKAADIPVVGDARLVLAEVNKLVKPQKRALWKKRIQNLRAEYPLTFDSPEGAPIKPQEAIVALSEEVGDKAIITTEVGQHQMWAAQFYNFTFPRQFISSGGLGTMGFGFPAAIGVALARPDKLAIDIAGDGSFQMVMQEVATAVQYGIPVKVFLLNNATLGMVRQWQDLFMDRRFSEVDFDSSPDYVKLAEAFGASGRRIVDKEELRPAIQEMITTPGPYILDVIVDPDELVFPMVPAGSATKDMIVRDSRKKVLRGKLSALPDN
ncbi:MAG: biosynthetic-type acetolactate synthase large subunit [Nitrospinae bacterium]|nr:biosynthetic-type acetolactate synthase large subunit [Nitrospinota bacterium]